MPRKLTKHEKDIVKLAKSGGTDKELAILKKIHEMEDEFGTAMDSFKIIKKNLADNFKNESAIVEKLFDEINDKLIIKLALKIAKMRKGDKGDNPTEKELLELIKPLIPSKVTDEQLKALIIPLIPEVEDGEDADEERIIEKLTEKIPKIEDIEDRLPKLGEQIRNSLELLQGEDRLDMDAIKGLKKKLEKIKKPTIIKGGGGGSPSTGGKVVKVYDISSQLNGTKKTFSLPSFWRVLTVQSSSFPNAFRPTTDYTTDASAMQITFTSEITASSTLASGQTIIIQYAE